MKRFWIILIIQLCLSIISAYFITQISWIGRMGITFFYTEYEVLKSFWKVFFILFSIQIAILFILHTLYSFKKKIALKIFSIIFSLISLLSLLYAIYDFSETFSHRILKEKFHAGVYIYLISIFSISLFYFLSKIRKIEGTESDQIINYD